MNRFLIPLSFSVISCARVDAPPAGQGPIPSSEVTPVALSAQLPAAEPSSAESPVDATISDRVRDAILAENSLRQDAAGVQVSTRDGVVTLSGSVRNAAIARQMEVVARAVGSVVSVENRLAVDPNARGGAPMEGTLDHAISDRVRAAFAQDALLQKELATVRVRSKDGVVTLTGTVFSLGARQQAGVVASAVGSVARVENELAVRRD